MKVFVHWSLPWFALFLAACSGSGAPSGDLVVLRLVDDAGLALPRAVVWTLPGECWERRKWLPFEQWSYGHNSHELLRRLGAKSVADESGRVCVARGAVVAGEHAGLAGVTTIATAGNAPAKMVLDDRRWTIVVRDAQGQPVAGVPVACAAEVQSDMGAWEEFEGLPIGRTDAEGRLVVRAPGSVDVARYMPRPVGGPDPAAPEFVMFEVDGMYLDAHAQRLSLQGRRSGSVTLTLPPVTKVEVRAPEWHGAIAAGVGLTRIGKTMKWDNVDCWVESGRCFALVGVSAEGAGMPVVAKISGSEIATRTTVPHLPAGETFPIQLTLDQEDVVVRARVLDAAGRPARLAVLRVTPTSEQLRTWYVRTDRDGRVALVLRAGVTDTVTLSLQVDAGSMPEWNGAHGELEIQGLRAGDHRDVGVVTLASSGK